MIIDLQAAGWALISSKNAQLRSTSEMSSSMAVEL
jgi:hypothetical protein